jgi:hypothetical protein
MECDFSGCPLRPVRHSQPRSRLRPTRRRPRERRRHSSIGRRYRDVMRNCREAPYRLYGSLAEVAVMHMVCDPN